MMTADTRRSESGFNRPLGVLVGFDGSELAALALRAGAREAIARGIGLTVVTASTTSPDRAESILAEAAELLTDPPSAVAYTAESGDAAGVLVEMSANAEAVVVGARGRGGFLGRVLGSVASALPAHAHAPTIILPRHSAQDTSGPVVVAVDGSQASRIALFTAAEEAAIRDTGLEVVTVLPDGGDWLHWYPGLDLGPEVSGSRARELETVLSTEADALAEQFPELAVTTSVKVGEPIATLAEATTRAQLVVLGSRGLGAVASALLGSVPRGVLNHAEGPVMIVPG